MTTEKMAAANGNRMQPMGHSPLSIANEFMRRAKKAGRELTHMQLQKLVYIANGWMQGAYGRQLVEDDPEAWEFGPVYRRLFDALKRYGRQPVDRYIHWGDDTPFSLDDGDEAFEELTPQESRIIDLVWEAYGDLEAFQLSALTHAEGTPWSIVHRPRQNRRIPQELIRDHFKELLRRYETQTEQ